MTNYINKNYCNYILCSRKGENTMKPQKVTPQDQLLLLFLYGMYKDEFDDPRQLVILLFLLIF